MKLIRFTVLVAIVLFASCNQKEKAEIARLSAENEELIIEAAEKDSIMMFMLDAFNEIEENLSEVADLQQTINLRTDTKGEKSENSRQRILNDIAYINALMEENDATIVEFQKQLDKARASQKATSGKLSSAVKQMGQMEKIMEQLKQQNNQKALEVEALKEELISMNFELEKVSMAYAKELQVAEEQQEIINTAYYTIGTFKELKNEKVLTRQGSFIGIGGAKALVEDFEKQNFIEIDITEVTEFRLDEKKVTMATTHPTDSYEFIYNDKKVEKLVILDPTAFWSISKFLVLVKK
jgi:monoamine oxidase